MRILCELRTAFFPPYMSKQQIQERTKQFEEGIASFLSYRHLLPDGTDVYLIDNTIGSPSEIPASIANMLDNHKVRVVVYPDNTLGSINKGAGEVGGLLYMLDDISRHDWFIHFEPRQVLKSFYLIESFLKEPRNLFTVNVVNRIIPHFNTGLYTVAVPDLLVFLRQFSYHRLLQMVNRRESLEYIMYDHFMRNTSCHLLDKMDLVWISPEGEKYHW